MTQLSSHFRDQGVSRLLFYPKHRALPHVQIAESRISAGACSQAIRQNRRVAAMQITEWQIPPQERRRAGKGWSQHKVLEGLDVEQET